MPEGPALPPESNIDRDLSHEVVSNPIVRLDELIPGADTRDLPTLEEAEKAFPRQGLKRRPSCEAGEISNPTAYAGPIYSSLLDGNGEVAMEVIKFFKGQIVVDLGAGSEPLGLRIAEVAEAKGCVEVEKYWFDDLERYIKRPLMGAGPIKGTRRIPVSIAPEDMLVFLRRLPDNSVSVFASGIESNIIADDGKRALIANEIKRVLNPRGAYVSANSDMNPYGLSQVELSRGAIGRGFSVYRKTEDNSEQTT